ncbi:MAG TPA: sigma-54 dependent transcriptional regulator [Planctomycetota bacterium]|nr:sigma-54 dependent transcriptional regulator [Planctomycetota bacterium]
MSSRTVLIADDDEHVLETLRDAVSGLADNVLSATTAAQTWRTVVQDRPKLVLLDLKFPDSDDSNLLKRIREEVPDAEVIIVSSTRDATVIVESIKSGAFDFISKPFIRAELRNRISRALELQELRDSRERLLHELEEQAGFGTLIGESPVMRKVRQMLRQLAEGETTVLLTGESGTGKELAARALHHMSSRRNRPFVAENMAAVPEHLAESVFFGHRRGAFTGAQESAKGFFELAGNGTLFLDEIGEMPMMQQRVLLRVMEYRRFKPVGDTRELQCSARFVLATNKDLYEQVRAGNFREDLYYRVSVTTVSMPPLRAHLEDIPLIAQDLLQRHCRQMGRRFMQLAPDAVAMMQEHTWPGNVRELRNVLETAMMLADPHQEIITAKDLPSAFRLPEPNPSQAQMSPLERQEMAEIRRVLQIYDGNQSKAAQVLGMHRNTLRKRLQAAGMRLGLRKENGDVTPIPGDSDSGGFRADFGGTETVRLE